MSRKPTGYSKASEEFLISACLENIRDAQFEFFGRYSAKLLGIALRFAGNEDTAHDMLQEAFIRIFTSLRSYNKSGPLEAWLRRIMIRTAIDFLKKHGKLHYEELDSNNGSFSVNHDNAYEHLNCEDILKAIGGLAEGYRTILNLYAIEGYSYTEISEILGIKEVTVRSQYMRARNKLAQQLFKEEQNRYVPRIV